MDENLSLDGYGRMVIIFGFGENPWNNHAVSRGYSKHESCCSQSSGKFFKQNGRKGQPKRCIVVHIQLIFYTNKWSSVSNVLAVHQSASSFVWIEHSMLWKMVRFLPSRWIVARARSQLADTLSILVLLWNFFEQPQPTKTSSGQVAKKPGFIAASTAT